MNPKKVAYNIRNRGKTHRVKFRRTTSGVHTSFVIKHRMDVMLSFYRGRYGNLILEIQDYLDG